MSHGRFFLVVLTMVTALTLSLVAPVAAVNPLREDLPFGDPFTLSGICPFDIELAALTSGQRITTFYDQEGNIVRQLITGPLKVRVTNLDTDESLDLNISGPGHILFEDDTGQSIQEGPWLTLILPGAFQDDPDLAGLFLTSGRVVSEFDPETNEFLGYTIITGRVVNVCDALAR